MCKCGHVIKEVRYMCLKGKKIAHANSARYSCKKCGAVHKKKGKLCSAEKIKQ